MQAESQEGGECVHGIFERIAARTPDAIAIEASGELWSYSRLNRYANLIARRLKASGVQRGDLVGCCLLRSPQAMASLLGVLKTGAAYVPFDLSYPPARLRFMLEDSGVRFLLSDDAGSFKLSGAVDESCVVLDVAKLDDAEDVGGDLAGVSCEGRDLAYMMYTSGSTGIPKGVLVEHRGIVRLVREPNYATLSAEEVFLQLSPLSFDASTFEIWGALLNGARLALPAGQALSLAGISEAIQKSGVTTLWLTSGLLNAMVDEHPEAFAGVRQLLAGGDVLSVDHVRRASRAMASGCVVNGYGPTENTTFTCCHRVTERDLAKTAIPIGRAISQTNVYILTSDRQPVMSGGAGELYIGGAGLARGYWRRPELTREKFVANPFSTDPHERLYRSGDLARLNNQGEIEFLGRIDHQVKVRGFRAEPGEVEAVLKELAGVSDCAVVAKGESADRKYLCCCFVPASGSDISPGAVAEYLRGKLPAYLVPDEYCSLSALPLDPNGKVDRRALAEMSSAPANPPGAPEEPTDELERQLMEIWKELFRLPKVGLDDDFFQLGGHSLLGARLFARVNQEFGRRIPLPAMFEVSTVRKLAAALRDESTAPAVSSCTKLRTGPGPSLFLVRHPGANVLNYRQLAVRLSPCTVYGLQPSDLDNTELGASSLPELAAKYNRALRRAQPRGPYWLGGYCAGGQIAYEMARQLAAEGDVVTLLALFDAMGEPESHELALAGRFGQVLGRSFRTLMWKARRVGPRAFRAELRQLGSDLKLAFARFFNHKVDPPTTVAEAFEVMRAEYSRLKYGGDIALFRTEESCEYSGTRTFGWQSLVTGTIEVHDIPGDHERILDEPQVEVFAKRLVAALRSAEERAGMYLTSGTPAFHRAES